MPKSEVSRGARRKRSLVGRAEFPSTLEGQIEEICRDLTVHGRRSTSGRARWERILS